MVEFSDGSVKAQLGPTDMRIPIQYALSYPERWETPCARVDYAALGELTFEPVDEGAFGCLRLAREAGLAGEGPRGRNHPLCPQRRKRGRQPCLP